MNVRALRKVQKQILAEPKLFGVALCFRGGGCGTVCCIAGYAAVNEGFVEVSPSGLAILTAKSNTRSVYSTGHAARLALDLTYDQGDALFFTNHWPARFERDYYKAKTARGKASVASRRIDHFIATKGAE